MTSSLVGLGDVYKRQMDISYTILSLHHQREYSPWRVEYPEDALPSWSVSYTHLTLPTICSV
eukprot:7000598-Prorocentrum_lima.AAC.1